MKYDVKAFELLSNEEIADGIFDMRVKNDELAPLAKCGQFAHVYVPSKTLRRPISVCDSENGVLRLVYQVKGEGTKIMSEMKKGEAVDILAPLGNGFNIEKASATALSAAASVFLLCSIQQSKPKIRLLSRVSVTKTLLYYKMILKMQAPNLYLQQMTAVQAYTDLLQMYLKKR